MTQGSGGDSMYANCSDKDIISQPLICVVGPTASGKSDLAQELAVYYGGEVISADSMQIYRGMNIGTGTLLPSERLVTHWGLDIIEPDEPYSAALFQKYARGCIVDIDRRNKRAILCGGTGFYVRAVVDDYDFPKGNQVENETRTFYTSYAQAYGQNALWELLREKDPKSASILHPNDVKRVVRAFELLEEGLSYAQQKEQLSHISPVIPAVFIGLRIEPSILNARIDARVDTMIEGGLLEEVRFLLEKGFRASITAPQAIGYKEMVSYLDGEMSFNEAISAIKIATHRYAKRQRTWFRKDTRIHWISAEEGITKTLLREAVDIVEAQN